MKPLGFFSRPWEFKYNGAGFVFYFMYMRYLLVFTILMFFIVGLYPLFRNLRGKTCDKYECRSFQIVAKSSIANRYTDYVNDEWEDTGDVLFFFLGCFAIVIIGSFYSCISSFIEKKIDKEIWKDCKW